MPYGERSGSVKDPFGNQWYIATHHARTPVDLQTVNSYMHPAGADRLIRFLQKAFSTEELEVYREHESGPIRHANIRLGDAIVAMGEADGQYRPMPTALHYYVPDVDAAYGRAPSAGATSIAPL